MPSRHTTLPSKAKGATSYVVYGNTCGTKNRFKKLTTVKTNKYNHIMMAMKTTLNQNGASFEVPQGTPEENDKLDASYEHLCKMRDELVTLNIVPPISEWSKINPNL